MNRWSALRVAIVNMWIASAGKPVSRKLVRSLLTTLFVSGITYGAAKLGFQVDPAKSAGIAQAAGLLAGFGAGWLTREFPEIVQDDGTVTVPRADPVSVPETPSGEPLTLVAPKVMTVQAAPVSELLKPAETEADTVTMPAFREAGPQQVGPRTVT